MLLGLLIPASILIHLWVSPYTKVEESFNLQAVHDITAYGIQFSRNTSHIEQNYDHAEFPGAVPRTFVGALLLSLLSSPILPFISSPKTSQLFGMTRLACSLRAIADSVAVRGLLGILNAEALLGLRHGLKRIAGQSAANWFVILQASQFHLMYYASRTLPNMFAFALSMYHHQRWFIN